jgi:hypothetical protein
MKPDDADYYRERAIQEQVAAQRATCEPARKRHEELAMMYRFRAAMLTTHPSSWAEYLTTEDVRELS